MRTTPAMPPWANVALTLLLMVTVLGSMPVRSNANTATPERLDSVQWAADCSVTYRLTAKDPTSIEFVRVRYWAYDAVRQRRTEMDAPGHTLRLGDARVFDGTLQWRDTGPSTRLYVYVSSFDRQGRSVGSTTRSGICQPKT